MNTPKAQSYLYSMGLVVLVSGGCYLFRASLPYKSIALILLLVVSLQALVFEMLPVIFSAILSAFVWNFFFIPPVFTFHIGNAEDWLLICMYIVVALLHTVLSLRIRQAKRQIRDKEEKEKTIKLYNTLLNSLSHELRTPISTILGAVDTLQDNKHLPLSNQKNLLDSIESASLRLNDQVENLLHMSRLESGTLQLKKDWCDPIELVENAVIGYVANPKIKQVFIEKSRDLPLVKVDEGLLHQVFQNLLLNFLDHTPSNCVMRISIGIDNQNLYYRLSDNGFGFPEADREKVFEKFYRLPNTSHSGTGLGLSIVKGYVEAHGGKIMLTASETGGACFELCLPVETNYINKLKHE
ncbi:MAG: PAS domain-containing sensor histidine kinase [Bacteroidia bacterium]|nr:PAS domain-containing sensor histidine kinase [Bacteroidia bacterium]